MCGTVNDIRKSFASLRIDRKMRHREIAHFLQITEAELVDAHVGVSKLDAMQSSPNLARAVRLKKSWPELIQFIEKFGEVMALTRNEYGVHEKIGVYKNISMQGDIGLVMSESIDLRLFYRHWELAYIFEEGKGDSLQRSVQFFDECGQAVHKVFLLPDSCHEAFEQMIDLWADSNQDAGVQVQEQSKQFVDELKSPEAFDFDAFKNDWANLIDTHDFFGLLKKYHLNRMQAFELIGQHYAEPLPRDAVGQLLNSAAHLNVPIMIFVGNRGAIQIHTGQIRRVLDAKGWLNVLDQDFNLHLRLTDIHKVWLVRKPTKDGVVSSMEILDERGDVIALIFGKRKPGQPELETWRDLLESCKETKDQEEAVIEEVGN